MFHVKHSQETKLIVLTGPTASGKTKLAVQLAQAIGGEIVSADSRQVYRGMDLGTGKDLAEYQDVPYHLIDILDPSESYSVSQFQQQASAAIQDIRSRAQVPILCGGTGHYIKALLQGYRFDHPAHNPYFSAFLESLPHDLLLGFHRHLGLEGPTDSNRRIARQIEKTYTQQNEAAKTENLLLNPLVYALRPDRKRLREKIKQRLDLRIEQGLVEEVQRLLGEGVSAQQLRKFGLEYRWVTDHITENLPLEAMKQSLCQGICQFAKRQETFFRYMEKEGIPIQNCPDIEQLTAEVAHWLSGTPRKHSLPDPPSS